MVLWNRKLVVWDGVSADEYLVLHHCDVGLQLKLELGVEDGGMAWDGVASGFIISFVQTFWEMLLRETLIWSWRFAGTLLFQEKTLLGVLLLIEGCLLVGSVCLSGLVGSTWLGI